MIAPSTVTLSARPGGYLSRRALVVGIGKYRSDAHEDMPACERDAERLKKVLQHRVLGQYRVTHVGSEPAHRVKKSVSSFFRKARANDTLLFYYTGHGMWDEGSKTLYLLASNSEEHSYEETAVGAAFVLDECRRSRAKKKVLVIDSCFSGHFIDDHLPRAFAEGKKRSGLSMDDDIAVIVSCRGDEPAYYNHEWLSLFTDKFIKGIESGRADPTSSGVVTPTGLFQYIEQTIAKGSQRPKRDIRGVSAIQLAYSVAESKDDEFVNPVQSSLSSLDRGWSGLSDGEEYPFFLCSIAMRLAGDMAEDEDYVIGLWNNYVGSHLESFSQDDWSWRLWEKNTEGTERVYRAPYRFEHVGAIFGTVLKIAAMKTPTDIELGMSTEQISLSIILDSRAVTFLSKSAGAIHDSVLNNAFKEIRKQRPNTLRFARSFIEGFADVQRRVFNAADNVPAEHYDIVIGRNALGYGTKHRIF